MIIWCLLLSHPDLLSECRPTTTNSIDILLTDLVFSEYMNFHQWLLAHADLRAGQGDGPGEVRGGAHLVGQLLLIS